MPEELVEEAVRVAEHELERRLLRVQERLLEAEGQAAAEVAAEEEKEPSLPWGCTSTCACPSVHIRVHKHGSVCASLVSE